ncbi:hypothetical protein BIV25_20550 [Streptomyces sp. MUSC 14]|nr:hypothetical protein BIV25_20550 [Streptomyces sp. MUSC 14]
MLPLTLVLWHGPQVPLEATGGLETVAVRAPDHSVALALLSAFGGGVTAPSANRFGSVSPTTADHVRAELADAAAHTGRRALRGRRRVRCRLSCDRRCSWGFPTVHRAGRGAFVSGKKKQNVRKTTTISDGQGRTLWSGADRPGRMHDQTAVRTEGTAEQFRLRPNVKAEVDEGYRGLADEFPDQVSAPP